MVPSQLEGFPSLAHFISKDADAAIFRGFSELGTRNLLYLQSNLHELEVRVAKLDQEDFNNRHRIDGLVNSARSYRGLKNAAGGSEGETIQRVARVGGNIRAEIPNPDRESYYRRRLDLHLKIKDAMREYREALIQEQQVRSFKPPPKRSLLAFQHFLLRKDGNILLGDDETLFGDLENPIDLVSLNPSEDDRLNRLLRYTCGYCFHDKKRKPYPDLDIFYYSDRAIHLTGYIVATVLSGILLVCAMLCLSLVYARSWGIRLGMVAMFTSLFAIVVGLLTNARRAELFGSTAAYAAVLVVYVSGNLGPPNPAGADQTGLA
ncbi:hypothetical protein BKA64DRAFT_682495 [Cadophora sp. MPI-SDFR-AT-0126]|nr:hypothetical protein BKA64DRAFT_682495 [Leotiomycetes sp. MPI-SDFR-AT-0126]